MFIPQSIAKLSVLIILTILVMFSCKGQTTSKSLKPEQLTRLSGTWLLTSRIIEGQEVPVTERLMRITIYPGGTFKADYRGDGTQTWIAAGYGGISYDPPMLILYWDSGAVSTLMVSETEFDQILVHHGRNLVPLKDQEPDEIFVRQKSDKGPTRAPS